MKKLVECVPNISDGRDPAVIDAVTSVIADVDGVHLLDVDPGAAEEPAAEDLGLPEVAAAAGEEAPAT